MEVFLSGIYVIVGFLFVDLAVRVGVRDGIRDADRLRRRDK